MHQKYSSSHGNTASVPNMQWSTKIIGFIQPDSQLHSSSSSHAATCGLVMEGKLPPALEKGSIGCPTLFLEPIFYTSATHHWRWLVVPCRNGSDVEPHIFVRWHLLEWDLIIDLSCEVGATAFPYPSRCALRLPSSCLLRCCLFLSLRIMAA